MIYNNILKKYISNVKKQNKMIGLSRPILKNFFFYKNIITNICWTFIKFFYKNKKESNYIIKPKNTYIISAYNSTISDKEQFANFIKFAKFQYKKKIKRNHNFFIIYKSPWAFIYSMIIFMLFIKILMDYK